MELSMTIAIVAALAIREIFTAPVITLFVLVAEILEGLTVGRGRTAIRHLVDLLAYNRDSSQKRNCKVHKNCHTKSAWGGGDIYWRLLFYLTMVNIMQRCR
jgi:hypothetical protein